jgi:hypothetical protein
MQILFEQKINISTRARTTVGLYRFKIPLTLPPVHICRPGCPSSPTSKHFDSTVIPLPPLFFSGDMLSCHLGFVMPLLLHTGSATCLILTWQGKKMLSLWFENFCHRVTVERSHLGRTAISAAWSAVAAIGPSPLAGSDG